MSVLDADLSVLDGDVHVVDEEVSVLDGDVSVRELKLFAKIAFVDDRDRYRKEWASPSTHRAYCKDSASIDPPQADPGRIPL